MLSHAVRTSTLRLIAKGPLRSSSVVTNRTMTTIHDKMKGKESVEEDRFARERDMEAIQKLKAKKQAELLAKNEDQAKAMHDEVIAPTMAIVEDLLKASGDKVSREALERIAKWKLDLH